MHEAMQFTLVHEVKLIIVHDSIVHLILIVNFSTRIAYAQFKCMTLFNIMHQRKLHCCTLHIFTFVVVYHCNLHRCKIGLYYAPDFLIQFSLKGKVISIYFVLGQITVFKMLCIEPFLSKQNVYFLLLTHKLISTKELLTMSK